MEKGGNGGGAAPTGCYKCGRPGHWSRDCPSNPNNLNPNKTTSYAFKAGSSSSISGVGRSLQPAEKPKKAPKKRPKLTPELLLSDDGLGYILRHFPRAFKYHGRGHEVKDLGNLLCLYAEWHSRLLPYYSFDQFVRKVEQVGATKHVRVCIRELRERVARGGDPTKLQETPLRHDTPNLEPGALDLEEPNHLQEDTFLNNLDNDDLQEDLLHEIYSEASEDPFGEDIADAAGKRSNVSVVNEVSNELQEKENRASSISSETQISEEIKARMEANRLKALERAAARGRSVRKVDGLGLTN